MTPFQKRLWLGGLGLLLFLSILVAASVLAPGRQAPWRALGRDFFVAYCAGTLAREGRWTELHDAPTFMRFQGEMELTVGLDPTDQRGPWLNPPFYAFIWMPLSALPYPLAWSAWTALTLLCLAVSAWLLARLLLPDASPTHEPPLVGCRTPDTPGSEPRATTRMLRSASAGEPCRIRAPAPRLLVPLLLGCSMPSIQTLCSGQSAAIALLLLAVAVTLWRSGRAFAAGVVAGLLAYKPQLGAIVAAVLVVTTGWRALLGLLVSGGILLLATWLFLPAGTLSTYAIALPKTVQFMQDSGRFVWNRHVTFRAFWHLLLHGRAGAEGWAAVALAFTCQFAVAGALVAALWRGRRAFASAAGGSATARDRLIAATVAAMPLLMPYYVDYDLLLLAVPAALLAREGLGHGTALSFSARPWLARAWVALYAWLFVNPGMAHSTHVNLAVPLLAAVAGGMIYRAGRAGSVALGTPDQSLAPVVVTLPKAA